MLTKTATFVFEKSTKGTHKFMEVDDQSVPARNLTGGIYIVKDVFGGKEPPKEIRVTVEY